MAGLSELQKGMDALASTLEMSAADIVATLKEKTMEVKGVHHRGGYNPFSYRFTDEFVKTLRDNLPDGAEETIDFKNIRGWGVEIPKKRIGKFWSIVESLRQAASKLYISGTKHMTEESFKNFLQKYREAEKKWEEEIQTLESKYDDLQLEFMMDAENTLRRAYGDVFDEALIQSILTSVQKSIPKKDTYIRGIMLSVDISESDNGLVFMSAEDKQTINELRSNSAKMQVTDMIVGTLQNAIDATSKALQAIYSPRTSANGHELRWIEDRQILAFKIAMDKVETDNLFSNPMIVSIVDSMKSAHQSMVRNLEGDAVDDLETVLGKTYIFAENAGLLKEVSYVNCPLSEDDVKDIAEYL